MPASSRYSRSSEKSTGASRNSSAPAFFARCRALRNGAREMMISSVSGTVARTSAVHSNTSVPLGTIVSRSTTTISGACSDKVRNRASVSGARLIKNAGASSCPRSVSAPSSLVANTRLRRSWWPGAIADSCPQNFVLLGVSAIIKGSLRAAMTNSFRPPSDGIDPARRVGVRGRERGSDEARTCLESVRVSVPIPRTDRRESWRKPPGTSTVH